MTGTETRGRPNTARLEAMRLPTGRWIGYLRITMRRIAR